MKEIKNINAKNLSRIIKYANVHSTDVVVTFVLDSFTKFFTCDAKASYIG
jgi:hypothetical protein